MAFPDKNALTIIEAPVSLGLRRPAGREEPGTWQAPAALRKAGLHERLKPREIQSLEHPRYEEKAAPGSRQLNGPAVRSYCERLAPLVAASLEKKQFPLVLGGDCSILLGCLFGARQHGPVGLVHLDGHSDYSNPNNQNGEPWLRAPAGMALALATGKGEPLLSDWGPQFTPLVHERDAAQFGERENYDPDYAFPDIETSGIHRADIRKLLNNALERCAEQALSGIDAERVWVHLDIDILDAAIMPAVDCPGSPGLDFDGLTALVGALFASRRIIGMNLTIYDPDLDPDGRYARHITEFLCSVLS